MQKITPRRESSFDRDQLTERKPDYRQVGSCAGREEGVKTSKEVVLYCSTPRRKGRRIPAGNMQSALSRFRKERDEEAGERPFLLSNGVVELMIMGLCIEKN